MSAPQTRGASKEHASLQALEVPVRCWARCGCLMKMYSCMFGIQEASFFHCLFHSYNVFLLISFPLCKAASFMEGRVLVSQALASRVVAGR